MISETTLLKQFPNGDTAVDYGNGLVYRTPEAAYTVELDPPGHPLSDEPFGWTWCAPPAASTACSASSA